MKSKPRILVVENSIAITGALESIIRSSQQLSNEYSFVFVLPKKSAAMDLVASAGFDVHSLRMLELRRNFFSIVCYLPALLYNSFALKKLLRKRGIDLIVANDFYNLVPAIYKMFGGNIPYICYVRFRPSKFPKPLVKFWCAWHRRYAFATIAVSSVVENELPYHDQVVVIGNELPTVETDFIPPENSTTILYPANYIRGKGHELALKSFALIASRYPKWKLRFVGGDMGLAKNKQFKSEMIQLCSSLQLGAQIEWRDFSEKISDEYIAASFVLNFSKSESFSLTCLEALFYGRPVIATRSGGPAEIIDDNVTGVLVDLDDVSAMASAIDYFISNHHIRHEMGKKGYVSAREKFSPARTTEKLGAVYRAACFKTFKGVL